MEYRVPSDEQVVTAVRKVMQRYPTISSQHRLRSYVERELRGKRRPYRVSAPRVRLLALKSGLVRIEIHSREGDPDKLLHRCPVCSSKLDRVKNLTLYGGEVTLAFRCEACGYWTGKKKKVPTLYVFHRKE